MKSKLLHYIKSNPDTWKQDLKGLEIKVKQSNDGLAIFNYASLGCDFTNPLVKEARGIILDLNNYKVVCWSFNKFGNVQESYADEIDWNSARAEDKLDGSIVKCYWYNGEWHWATNSCIDAKDADSVAAGCNYMRLIKMADNHNEILEVIKNKGNKDCTYTFELCDPWNHVVKYPKVTLHFIGVRNINSGLEEIPSDNFPELAAVAACSVSYPVSSLEECLDAAAALNSNGVVTKEGFVVVDKNFHRVKVKNMEYILQHHLTFKPVLTVKDYLEGEIVNPSPKQVCQMKWYDWQKEEVYVKADEMATFARALYEEYEYDRGAVAKVIKDDVLAIVGFHALDNNKAGRELLGKKLLSKLIKPYELV